jgi:hydrogenase maturation protease
VDRIADAILYEGYIIYPYRPSIKNRQRWTFGGLFPEAYCQAGNGETASNQTECLVQGKRATTIEAVVRFLHLTQRSAGEIATPLTDWPQGSEPTFRPVETLRVGDQLFHAWQEAEEREISLGATSVGELLAQPQCVSFRFPGGRRMEPVRGTEGEVAGVLVREEEAIAGIIEARAEEATDGLFRFTLRVVNRTSLPEMASVHRDAVLLRSLVSTHAILGVEHGAFISLLDPPERWREAAAACRNVGVWPVLVGAEGDTHTMLSSPIILYDYPQVAPESPGDLFDGTEIDEILTLRILTLTDAEKRAMASVDDRARELLTRTEALAREQMLGLHGAIRTKEEKTHG